MRALRSSKVYQGGGELLGELGLTLEPGREAERQPRQVRAVEPLAAGLAPQVDRAEGGEHAALAGHSDVDLCGECSAGGLGEGSAGFGGEICQDLGGVPVVACGQAQQGAYGPRGSLRQLGPAGIISGRQDEAGQGSLGGREIGAGRKLGEIFPGDCPGGGWGGV
jgi:hypothetical protein